MKNKIKYFILFPLMLLIVILTLTYDVKELIGLGQRIPFGSSYWKDSLVDAISTNKSIKLGTGDSIYYNGVVVTSGTGGGGIAASDNITFTGRDSTAELWRFGDSVRFYEHVLFKDTLKVSGAIAVMDSLKVSKNLWFNNTTKLSTTLNTFYILENAFQWQNQNAYNILDLDSSNGMNLHYGVYTGSGTGLTNVDAITLKGQDTTHFARTDTLTTEDIKGAWNFWNIVRCIGIVTFDVSPVFNSVVNFANGITTTTLTVSSTATFNGDVKNTGWRYQGASSNIDKYFRDTIIRTVCGATGTTVSVPHGISNTSNICMFTYQIKDDSSGLVLTPNATNGALVGTGLLYYPPYIDATNINLRIAATMINLDNNTDTIKYFLRVTDYNR